MSIHEESSVCVTVPASSPAASWPYLLLSVCLTLTGCENAIKTNPLSAGQGDTVIHLGNGGHEAWRLYGSEEVGYKFASVSFFWMDLWTWDGTYCAYSRHEKTYKPISIAEAARLLRQQESALEIPFAYRVPLGWLIFGPFLLLGAICSLVRTLRKRAQAGGESASGSSSPRDTNLSDL